MEPRNNIISIGENARNLADYPLPEVLQNDLAMRQGMGDDVLSQYEELKNKVIGIGDRVDELGQLEQAYKDILKAKSDNIEELTGADRQVQQQLRQARQQVIEQRREISDLVNQTPELVQVQQAHAQHFLENNMEDLLREQLEKEDPQEIHRILMDSLPKKESAELNRQLVNDPKNNDRILRDAALPVTMQDTRKSFQNEFDSVVRARQQQHEMLRVPQEQFNQMVQGYANSEESLVSPEDIAPYLEEGSNRQEFLDNFGPIMANDYIASRSRPNTEKEGDGTPVESAEERQRPGEGVEGIDPDHFGTGDDPLHVIVDDILDSVPLNVNVVGVADGVGIGGGGGGGGPGRGKGDTDTDKKQPQNDDALMRGFGMQQFLGAGNTAADLATPGGQSMSAFTGGMLGSAAQGAGFLGNISTKLLAPLAVGSLAYSTGMNIAEHQRGLERTFGESEGTGQVMQEQIDARLSHWFITSEEITGLTESLASLGLTAEETAVALGPAADALSRYRVINEEIAARAAGTGAEHSFYGAQEANILGRVMENLSGQGASAESTRGAIQFGQEELSPGGFEGGEEVMAGLQGYYAAGDMYDTYFSDQNAAQDRGTSIQQAQASPMENLQLMSTLTGEDFTDVDISTREGMMRWNEGINQIIDEHVPDDAVRIGEDGSPIVDSQAEMDVMMAQSYLSDLGLDWDVERILREKQHMTGVGGPEEANKIAEREGPKAFEEERTGQGEIITGKRAAETEEQGKNWFNDNPIRNEIGKVSQDFAYGLGLDFLAPGNTAERGSPGSGEARRLWDDLGQGPMRGVASQRGFDEDAIFSEVDGELKNIGAIARENPEIMKEIQAGERKITTGKTTRWGDEVSVEATGKKMTAMELSTLAQRGDAKFDERGLFDWGGNRLEVQGLDKLRSDPESQRQLFDLTEEAKKLLRPLDAKDPYNMAGQTTQAQNREKTGRGKEELHSNRPHYGP